MAAATGALWRRMIARRCPASALAAASATSSRCRRATGRCIAAFAREQETFWHASRPSFGGHALPPHRLGTDFDWPVLEADPRWREAIVELFAAAAAAVGAFYAECWVEPGWNVSRTNRLSIGAGRKRAGPRSARTAGRALPAEPAWLTWYGGEYRDPVGAALDGTPAPRRRASGGWSPLVDARPEGVLVRLGERAAGEAAAAPAPRRAAQAAGLSSRPRSAVKPG